MGSEVNQRYETNLNLYKKLIETHPEIERKGKTMPYTSMNGHMFSILSKDGSLGLRLPRDERERFIKHYDTNLHESYGAVMKEYVTVPDELLADTQELSKYLKISFEYIKTLKPKPSRK